MNKIQFENRLKIDETVITLDAYLQDHPNAEEKETFKKLSRLLDAMYMEW